MQNENNQVFDFVVQSWLELVEKLKEYEEAEMKLRKQIALHILQEDKPEEFSKKLALGQGYFLKATQNLNYTINKTDGTIEDKIDECMEKLRKAGFIEVSKNIFKFSPSLSKTHYKQVLDENCKSIIDEYITCKIGAPKVEFITPKVKE